MNESRTRLACLVLGIVVFFMWLHISEINTAKAEIESQLDEQITWQESTQEELVTAETEIERLKGLIDDANVTISDAESAAWLSYEEMGEALEGMSEVIY